VLLALGSPWYYMKRKGVHCMFIVALGVIYVFHYSFEVVTLFYPGNQMVEKACYRQATNRHRRCGDCCLRLMVSRLDLDFAATTASSQMSCESTFADGSFSKSMSVEQSHRTCRNRMSLRYCFALGHLLPDCQGSFDASTVAPQQACEWHRE
jgi:hypothetical protein